MSLVCQVADQIFALIRSWYFVDRIRVSPSAGRMLQLRNGQSVLICGEPALVRSRTMQMCDDEAWLEYRLDYIGANCTLAVRVSDSARSSSGQIACGDRVIPVFDDDIVLLTSRSAFSPESDDSDTRLPIGRSRV